VEKDLFKGILGLDESPFKVVLVNVVPLGDWCVVVCGGSINVDAFSRVNKFDGIPTVAKFVKFHLNVTLVAMSSLVPEGDSSVVFAVGSKLVHGKVGVDACFKEVVSTTSFRKFPFEVILVTMSILAPEGDLSFVVSSSTKDVSNSVRGKFALDVESFVALGEFLGLFVGLLYLLVNSLELPFKVVLVNPIPLVDGSVVVGGCTINMDILSRVNKFNAVVTISTVMEVHTAVTLVSMSGPVPESDGSSVVRVGSELVNYKVGVNCGLDPITTIWSTGQSPLQVILVSMSILAPNGKLSFIVSSSTKDVGNSVRCEG